RDPVLRPPLLTSAATLSTRGDDPPEPPAEAFDPAGAAVERVRLVGPEDYRLHGSFSACWMPGREPAVGHGVDDLGQAVLRPVRPGVGTGDGVELVEPCPGLNHRGIPRGRLVRGHGVAPDGAAGEVARGSRPAGDLQLRLELGIAHSGRED